MKKIIVILFLFAAVTVSAQDIPDDDTTSKPAITAIGKPDGAMAEMKIGKEGGSLKSSDGKVELIFPAGALKENTNIIIQPVTNLAPNGSGKAYWFEPSGIQFKKPVQIIINYTDEEAEVCPPDLMGLAIQNKQGQWSFIDYDSWDSTARLLTGSINHFSGAANVNKLMLIPNYVRIKVNSNFQFKVVNISSYFNSSNQNDNTFYHNPPIGSDIIKAILWYVNDIQSGDFHNGHIVSESIMGRGIYKAPNSLPKINPVTLKAELYLPKKSKEGKTLNLVKTLTSKILIYDNAYEVKMTSIAEQLFPGSQLGTFTYLDSGSFVVSLSSGEAKLIEKVNKNVSDKMDFAGKCKVVQLKPGSGLINIIGADSIKITPAASPKDNPWIEINFIYSPVIYPLLKFICPPVGGKGKDHIHTTEIERNLFASLRNYQAFPQTVKFELKKGKNVILLTELGKSSFKMTVEQLPDD